MTCPVIWLPCAKYLAWYLPDGVWTQDKINELPYVISRLFGRNLHWKLLNLVETITANSKQNPFLWPDPHCYRLAYDVYRWMLQVPFANSKVSTNNPS